MAQQAPPPNWSADELTAFFDVLRGNTYATFVNMQPQFGLLVAIDSEFRKLQENLRNTKDWFAALFLLRSHSNFLAAVQLVAAGQHPESFALLRSCLETALYGVYLNTRPESRETWLRRNDSDDARKAVRNEFQWCKLLVELARLDRRESEAAQKLYERCIEFGAHPNEQALMQSLRINKTEAEVEFLIVYAGGEATHFRYAMKTAAQVGVCALSMFCEVFRERCDILGISDRLKDLKKGL